MNIIICQICNETKTTHRRSDTKYCEQCRTKRSWYTWGRTDKGRQRRAESHRALRQKAFDGYGGCCNCCGENVFEFLALDHVNGGGREERKKLSTAQIATKVIRLGYPSDYRVLCHNCNQAIGWYGSCPHQCGNELCKIC